MIAQPLQAIVAKIVQAIFRQRSLASHAIPLDGFRI